MVKRGFQNGTISDTDVARLYGRIEREIESICLATGTPFGFIASRIGELLYPLGSRGAEGEVPLLRGATTDRGTAVAALEMVEHSHDHASPRSGTGNHAERREKTYQGKVTAAGKRLGRPPKVELSASKKYWMQFTPEQRSAIMKKRAKVAIKNGKPMLRTLTPGSKKKSDAYLAKQRFYVARSVARKAGVPESKLPPLPPPPPRPVQVQ
jgi:hypothetical protein